MAKRTSLLPIEIKCYLLISLLSVVYANNKENIVVKFMIAAQLSRVEITKVLTVCTDVEVVNNEI